MTERVQFTDEDREAINTGDDDEGGTGATDSSDEAQTVKPEYVPDKFWDTETGQVNVEAMAKSYLELERGRGQKPPAEAEEPPIEEAPEETSQDQARETIENAGLDFDAFSQEFAENGGLTEDSYQTLEQAGIPRAYVNGFISGQQAIAANIETQVMGTVGGKDTYQQMVQWASQNLSPNEIQAYDNAVNHALATGDPAQATLAAQGLMSRYQKALGGEPEALLNGENGNPNVTDVFGSMDDVREAMADPRYKSNKAYRQEVINKLSRSNI